MEQRRGWESELALKAAAASFSLSSRLLGFVTSSPRPYISTCTDFDGAAVTASSNGHCYNRT